VNLRSRALTVAFGVTLALGVLISPGQASPTYYGDEPFCGQVWGSLPEAEHSATAGNVVTEVRSGRHVCFDRLVIDLRGPATGVPAYDVRYVDRVAEQGSGHPIPLRGGAELRVLVDAPAYDGGWNPTYLPDTRSEVVDVSGYQTFRQVAWAGSYEGRTALAVGTRARLPFRAFVLLGEPGSDRSARLVVDVGHRW
jgi:hypothetical protein